MSRKCASAAAAWNGVHVCARSPILVCETSIVAFGAFLDRLLARLQCARLLTRQEDSETTQAKPVKHLRLLRSRLGTFRVCRRYHCRDTVASMHGIYVHGRSML